MNSFKMSKSKLLSAYINIQRDKCLLFYYYFLITIILNNITGKIAIQVHVFIEFFIY